MIRLVRAMALFMMVTFGLTGCAGQRVSDYAAERPVLDLERYFAGKTLAWGMFQDRSGTVIKRFTVSIDGRIENGRLILDEDFTYSDGTKEQRIWTLEKTADGQWRGRAGDVVGEAKGSLSGNAFQWQYTLALPVGDSVYNVQFDDWMYLIDDTTLINRARMSKWGIELGQVTLFFRKQVP
jgi:hypothetical protein